MSLALSSSLTVDDLRARLHQAKGPGELPPLPVHPDLSGAFPEGLRAGGVHAVHGSVATALGLLAGPSQKGSWCAVVGLPDVGVEAIAAWGVRLERLILAPVASEHWTLTVAALIDVADLIVASPVPRIADSDRSRLTARLRDRRAALVVLGPWTGALSSTHVSTVGWDGLAQGHGCLSRQRLALQVTERHRTRRVKLCLAAS